MRHPATLRLSTTNGFSKKKQQQKKTTIRDNVFVAGDEGVAQKTKRKRDD